MGSTEEIIQGAGRSRLNFLKGARSQDPRMQRLFNLESMEKIIQAARRSELNFEEAHYLECRKAPKDSKTSFKL